MSNITAILWIPDESSFLGTGACGSRLPLVFRGYACGHSSHRKWRVTVHESCYMCGDPQMAVALAWEGESLPQGCLGLAAVKDWGSEWLDILDGVETTLRYGVDEARFWPEPVTKGRLVFIQGGD